MTMLRAVTFDFWETLVHDSAEKMRDQRLLRIGALHQVLGRADRVLDLVDVVDAYDRSEHMLVERFWSRDRDPAIAEQVRLVLEIASPGAGDDMTPALFEEAIAGYIEPVLQLPPELEPGAAEAVRELASRGVALGIVSNTGRTPGIILRRVLERHDLLRHFTAISYSDEVGYRKPDAEIFRRTLAELGIEASHAAHVGDNPIADVRGAQGAGMRGVHYAAGGRQGASHADLIIADLGDLVERLTR
ncbi:MAG TPA: HAD family hydrolase [Methylomirabilota bacterium]